MTISKDFQRLEQHLAQYGLQAVAIEQHTPEVFKICFLNKIERAQWEKQRRAQGGQPLGGNKQGK